MPITALDPHTALLIVDLQKGIVSIPAAHPVADVIHNATTLAHAFRQHHLPVVLINVIGAAPGRTEQPSRTQAFPADWDQLIPELNQQPSDLLISKRTWGAFASTDLERQLKALGVTQVVIVGISTSAGVESTARQTYEAGFNVILATDAMTDRVAENHNHSIQNIFPRIAQTGTTAEILALLNN